MSPSYAYTLALVILLAILALAAYVDRIYSEMGKFLAREYQDNIDSWERVVEPRLRLGRESIALSASVLRQLSLAALALLSGLRLYGHTTLVPTLARIPTTGEILRGVFELILLILIFDRLLPQLLFSRTRGLWIARIAPILQALFYLILPVTLLLGLLLSIAALAEPEDATEEDHPSEAMDALLEAGEEEGILEESDRELVRSAVEFGDKVVLEVMTPRPEIFAVPGTLTCRSSPLRSTNMPSRVSLSITARLTMSQASASLMICLKCWTLRQIPARLLKFSAPRPLFLRLKKWLNCFARCSVKSSICALSSTSTEALRALSPLRICLRLSSETSRMSMMSQKRMMSRFGRPTALTWSPDRLSFRVYAISLLISSSRINGLRGLLRMENCMSRRRGWSLMRWRMSPIFAIRVTILPLCGSRNTMNLRHLAGWFPRLPGIFRCQVRL